MFNLKLFSLSITTLLVAATVGVFCSSSAEALTIKRGRVIGTWDYDLDGGGGFNQGDTFVAEFTYDSDRITTRKEFYSEKYYYFEKAAPLLSLALNSGSISHRFDIRPGEGVGSFGWYQFQSTSPEFGQRSQNETFLSAFEFLSPVAYSFYARASSKLDYYGSPSSESFASSYSYDYSNDAYLLRAESDNATFSGATSVPTPALLPGLIGLAVAVIKKRQADQAKSDADEEA